MLTQITILGGPYGNQGTDGKVLGEGNLVRNAVHLPGNQMIHCLCKDKIQVRLT